MKILVGRNPMGLEQSFDDLRTKYPDIAFVHVVSPEDTIREIADADVYVGWLNKDIYLAAKNLRWIQSPSSGINYYLAIPELVASDVLLTSARGTHGACLAESVFGMIFAFTRQIKYFVADQKDHKWRGTGSRANMCELTGSTMGIVGLGTVGRAIAKRAAAFDMNIIAVDLLPSNKPDHVSELWGLDKLNDMMAASDYVVVTVPYTPETDNMIGAEQLVSIKDGALLIGISRGHIIDEEAMVAALKSGKLSAAALDVFAQEPLPEDSELWDIENLLITPHAAGGTQLERQHILDIFYENIGRFVRGELPLRNQIDKVRGF